MCVRELDNNVYGKAKLLKQQIIRTLIHLNELVLLKDPHEKIQAECLWFFRKNFPVAGVLYNINDSIKMFVEEENKMSSYIAIIKFHIPSTANNFIEPVTISFSIYKRISEKKSTCKEVDFLQTRDKIITAGYVVSGMKTFLAYAFSGRVRGYIMENTKNELKLFSPSIICPDNGIIYSIDQAHILHYDESVRNYISDIQSWCLLYPQSFIDIYTQNIVADFHRILMLGGCLLYPKMDKKENSRTTILFDYNPLSYIIKTAKGISLHNIFLDKLTHHISLDQKCSLYLGSNKVISDFLRFTTFKHEHLFNGQ